MFIRITNIVLAFVLLLSNVLVVIAREGIASTDQHEAAIHDNTKGINLHQNHSRQLYVNLTSRPRKEPDIVPNPSFPGSCGANMNITLILDSSTSITEVNAEDYIRNAAKAFVSGLVGTGSSLAIIEMDTNAYLQIDRTPVTKDTKADFDSYIDNVYPYDLPNQTDFTNWDDAFNKTRTLNEKSLSQLVVFITDGESTAFNRDYAADDQQGTVTITAYGNWRVWRAMEEANCVKEQGSRILAVAVGSDITTTNLEKISGNTTSVGGIGSIRDVDVVVSPNFEHLADAVKNLVFDLCGASVTVTSVIDGEVQNGQAFSGVVEGSDYQWEAPDDSVLPGQPAVGTTAGHGTLTFQWNYNTDGSSGKVWITREESNYYIIDIECSKRTPSNETITLAPALVNGSTFELLVEDRDIITCDVIQSTTLSPTAMPSISSAPSAVIKEPFQEVLFNTDSTTNDRIAATLPNPGEETTDQTGNESREEGGTEDSNRESGKGMSKSGKGKGMSKSGKGKAGSRNRHYGKGYRNFYSMSMSMFSRSRSIQHERDRHLYFFLGRGDVDQEDDKSTIRTAISATSGTNSRRKKFRRNSRIQELAGDENFPRGGRQRGGGELL